MRRTAALIVGGGPAGSAAALTLADAGVRPLVLERTREPPDQLCGGFLSWRTLDALAALGLRPAGAPVRRLRLFARGRVAEAPLPAPSMGLSRRTLDAALLALAAGRGAAVERGVTVRDMAPGHVRLRDGADIAADALFLAVGKHDLRGHLRPRVGDDPALGLRVRLRPPPALVGDAIELHLFRGGYAGLVQQEDGSANLCMAVAKSRLVAHDGDPRRLLRALGDEAPALGERLGWEAGGGVDAVAAVPYGWRARSGEPGLFRLGDQAAVIPSLAGEGMAIAIASGRSAAAALLAVGPAGSAHWQPRFAARARRPLAVAGAIRRLADGGAAPGLVRLAAAMPSLAGLLARATRLPDDA